MRILPWHVGVGWVVLIDEWLSRGGPGGAMLGFLLGGLLLLPVARTCDVFQDVATLGLPASSIPRSHGSTRFTARLGTRSC